MKTSDAGRKLIESFEGLRLSAYKDQHGILTIGYGSTTDVFASDVITQQEADDRLGIDLFHAEQAVSKNVKITLTQDQFDALVSLAFNIGAGAFARSTLVKLLNDNDVLGAGNQFLVWCKVAGKDNEGLLNRRNSERKLFLGDLNVTGIAK